MIMMPIAILAMAEGDDRDFMEQLYRERHKLMYAIAWKHTNDSLAIDDIISDSCVALIKNVNTLRDLNEEKLKTYIVITVTNMVRGYYNKQKRSIDHMFTDDGTVLSSVVDAFDVEKKVVLTDELARVWRAIDQLPEKEKQVMRLKYGRDLPDEQIAEIVGLSVSSVRKYVGRAREHVRKMIYEERAR